MTTKNEPAKPEEINIRPAARRDLDTTQTLQQLTNRVHDLTTENTLLKELLDQVAPGWNWTGKVWVKAAPSDVKSD